MSEMDRAKEKIRKLLAMASDDEQADGEITAAMNLATAAMEKYHLTHADIEAAAPKGEIPIPTVMGKTETAGVRNRLLQWEGTLHSAVMTLVGTVGAYRVTRLVESDAFKATSKRAAIVWFGPAEDAQLAAELFDDWNDVISTMAQGRFGNVIGGPGALYCKGFADALMANASAAARHRREVVTESTRALALCSGGSLEQVLAAKKAEAKRWLETTQDIKLGSARRSSGYRNFDPNATMMEPGE